MLIAISTAKDENIGYGARRGAKPLCVTHNPPRMGDQGGLKASIETTAEVRSCLWGCNSERESPYSKRDDTLYRPYSDCQPHEPKNVRVKQDG